MNETKIDLYMCGHCEKAITGNLIASFGNDHHDPDEMYCESCFNGAVARAELNAEITAEDAWAMVQHND